MHCKYLALSLSLTLHRSLHQFAIHTIAVAYYGILDIYRLHVWFIPQKKTCIILSIY